MKILLATLAKSLDDDALASANVIPWSCPVLSFGDPYRSTVATLGLNPSNREFVDLTGKELEGPSRRFHTLRSLKLARWSEARPRHLSMIEESCRAYFSRNPYDGWFRQLDYIISGTKASYYSSRSQACHLDLIPYATACKWAGLSQRQRTLLLAIAGDSLGLLLRDTPIRTLVLNGRSVVENFQNMSGISLDKTRMRNWSLPRHSEADVAGFSYCGVVDSLAGIRLRRSISVLGYNHNIQSSFGVTTKVKESIQRWIAANANVRRSR